MLKSRDNDMRSGDSTLIKIVDLIVLITSVVCGILLLISYLANYVAPSNNFIIPLIGLIAPILYIINFTTILYWVIRWSRLIIIPLVPLVIGVGFVTLFFKPFVNKKDDTKIGISSSFNIVTYNARGFMEMVDGKYVSVMDSSAQLLSELKPDIMCIQEFQTTPKATKAMFDKHFPTLNRSISNIGKNKSSLGVVIYTKFPIIRSGNIEFKDSNNSAVWADIRVNKSDTVRLFSCHLQTTGVTSKDKSYLEHYQFLKSKDVNPTKLKLKGMISKLHENYIIRETQADSISNLISKSPYPTIVCGDFNDTPLSYTYKTIKQDMSDAFVESGRGYSTTFNGFFSLLRIDYVLYTPEYTSLEYKTFKNFPSDHLPVMVSLTRNL